MPSEQTHADAGRVSAILGAPAAQDRMPQAIAIAAYTDLTADEAIALLKALAEAAEADAAAPPRSRIPSIEERAAGTSLADLGVTPFPPDHRQAAGASGWDRALAKAKERLGIAAGSTSGAGR